MSFTCPLSVVILDPIYLYEYKGLSAELSHLIFTPIFIFIWLYIATSNCKIKSKFQLIPLYVCTGIGMAMSLFYTIRLATRNPDVGWNRSQLSNEAYRNKQYKVSYRVCTSRVCGEMFTKTKTIFSNFLFSVLLSNQRLFEYR